MSMADEVITKILKVSNGLGIHARVATRIVQKMQEYSCAVTLTKDDVEVDARSVLGLLLLAAAPGSEVLVKAKGPDGGSAIQEIARLIQSDEPQG
ncbi:MAG: HPr family phosphocarrier protein [Deltaproteobacteria bacterium]|nr:HPr family phosphocarrier protein [Deltaproteobacteria bacterium]